MHKHILFCKITINQIIIFIVLVYVLNLYHLLVFSPYSKQRYSWFAWTCYDSATGNGKYANIQIYTNKQNLRLAINVYLYVFINKFLVAKSFPHASLLLHIVYLLMCLPVFCTLTHTQNHCLPKYHIVIRHTGKTIVVRLFEINFR